jgi:folylpolyglutamate synthase/dihydropteroate synthase
VAVITNVGLDHTDRLGPTVRAIAREKAAIVMRGDHAVTGASGEALAVVRRRCARLGVPLTVASPPPVLGWTRDALTVELPRLGPTAVGLRGRHQAANVATADALLDALESAGIATVPAAARRAGYANARWAGRLELLEVAVPGRGTREVLLDRVWGYDFPGNTRTVDVHINRLRKKIPSLAPNLTAVRSLGYKLAEEEAR